MSIGDPPIRPKPVVDPNPPEFTFTPTGSPGIMRDQHGRLHNQRCPYCSGIGKAACWHCLRNAPVFKPEYT